jgi:hypothetical protein
MTEVDIITSASTVQANTKIMSLVENLVYFLVISNYFDQISLSSVFHKNDACQ